MSKFIAVLHRVPIDAQTMRMRLSRAMEEIAPDHQAPDHWVETRMDTPEGDAQGQAGWATLNWPDMFAREGLSLCQAKLFAEETNWDRIGTPCPDMAGIILRVSETHLEAFNDVEGTRSLFVYHDDDILALSNSQRALTIYTGQFAPNKAVAPWLICAGNTGPDLSYNRHLRLLAPEAHLTFSRANWALSIDNRTPTYRPVMRSAADEEAALDQAIRQTMRHFKPQDADQSVIMLSGGYDSRGVAAYLHATAPEARWRSLTGGGTEAETTPGTDGFVAAQVARHYNFIHRFEPNVSGEEPAATCLRRFVLCAEGRVDEYKGYANGMVQLLGMFRKGERLSFRGDIAMGVKTTDHPDVTAVRHKYVLFFGHELAELGETTRFGWPEMVIPDQMQPRADETHADWCDRFQRMYYAWLKLSALNETKTAYVDIAAPFLSRRVVDVVETLPQEAREYKALFRRLVDRIGPDIPYASGLNSNPLPDFVTDPAINAETRTALTRPGARTLFGDAFLAHLERVLKRERNPLHKIKARLQRKLTGAKPRPKVRPQRMLFRAYMGALMVETLERDAALFGPHAKSAPRAAGLLRKSA